MLSWWATEASNFHLPLGTDTDTDTGTGTGTGTETDTDTIQARESDPAKGSQQIRDWPGTGMARIRWLLNLILHQQTTQPDMPSARARQILVGTHEIADDLKTRIDDGADFAALAGEYSSCPSGKKGGDLGDFGPGQMVKEFDEVAFSAPVGEVQGPVKTEFGFHLIEVTYRTA